MRVLIYTADEMRCGHRLIWPAQALKAQGADIDWIQRDNPDHTPWEQGADVVVMQRPMLRRFAEAIPRVQADGMTVVVDIDDDFKALNPRNWAFPRTSPKATWHINREGEPVQLGGPDCNWHHLDECCRLADLVTVTTPALASRFAKHGRVRIIPNHVPASYFNIDRPKHSTVQVGWTGAVTTHPDDLQVTRGAIPRALDGTGARFMQVGPPEGVETNLGLSPGILWATGFVDLDSYPYAMAQIDVGIVPLELTAFNQAKSYLKMLEFAALGVAAVGSPTEDNRRLAERTGQPLAAKPKDWERHVRRLIVDDEHRTEVAATAREAVRGDTVEGNAHLWWDAWEDVHHPTRRKVLT